MQNEINKAVCLLHQAAWSSGRGIPIERLLAANGVPPTPELILDLIQVELNARRSAGEDPAISDYLPRFPTLEAAIRNLFGERAADTSAISLSGTQNVNLAKNRMAPAIGPPTDSTFGLREEMSKLTARELEGKTLGRFQLIKLIGKGSFGAVYRAYDPNLDLEVAIKIPRPGVFEQDEDADRFLREARAAARLHHPNIVRIYDAGQVAETCYLSVQLIEGEGLDSIAKLRRFTPAEAATLIATLARALDYAHSQKVIHRDIKPANIMVDKSGVPVIMDFGLARRDASHSLRTQAGMRMGTPAYMSPEQASGKSHLASGPCDQWALGVIFYELLTNRLPFPSTGPNLFVEICQKAPPPIRSIQPSIPEALENICNRALSKSAEKRFATCGEFAKALEAWLGGNPKLAMSLAAEARSAPSLDRATAVEMAPEPSTTLVEPVQIATRPAPKQGSETLGLLLKFGGMAFFGLAGIGIALYLVNRIEQRHLENAQSVPSMAPIPSSSTQKAPVETPQPTQMVQPTRTPQPAPAPTRVVPQPVTPNTPGGLIPNQMVGREPSRNSGEIVSAAPTLREPSPQDFRVEPVLQTDMIATGVSKQTWENLQCEILTPAAMNSPFRVIKNEEEFAFNTEDDQTIAKVIKRDFQLFWVKVNSDHRLSGEINNAVLKFTGPVVANCRIRNTVKVNAPFVTLMEDVQEVKIDLDNFPPGAKLKGVKFFGQTAYDAPDGEIGFEEVPTGKPPTGKSFIECTSTELPNAKIQIRARREGGRGIVSLVPVFLEGKKGQPTPFTLPNLQKRFGSMEKKFAAANRQIAVEQGRYQAARNAYNSADAVTPQSDMQAANLGRAKDQASATMRSAEMNVAKAQKNLQVIEMQNASGKKVKEVMEKTRNTAVSMKVIVPVGEMELTIAEFRMPGN